jgi:sarcosine oxidase, subunit beta
VADRRVVVVGAGVLGLFTAYELVGAGGVEVTVIDQAHPGDGSSGRAVGMVETQFLTAPDVEVRAYGRQAYAALERDHGLRFVHGGYLRLGRVATDQQAFEASVDLQRDFGVPDAEVLSATEIARRWPPIVTDGSEVGLFGSWDGYVDGYEVCGLLTDLVRRGGGTVRPSTALVGAERTGSGWLLRTGRGQLEADLVVNAAGPWAAAVGDLLGAPVDLLPELHGAVTVELGSPWPFLPMLMDYVPGTGVDGVYFRSDAPDRLIAGLHSEVAIGEVVSPDVELGGLANGIVERVIERLADRLRDTDDLAVGRTWTGIYPMSPTHQPVAGRHATAEGVVCALGAGGNGIQLSPAVGRITADAVLGRTSPFQTAPGWQHR